MIDNDCQLFCSDCTHYHYDTFYDEIWCDELKEHLCCGCHTCEYFESWELKEKQRIKQQYLFPK